MPNLRRGAFALLLALLATGCKPAAPPKPFNPDGLSGPLVSPAIPKPSFVLTATDGTPFDFKPRTEGYVTLLFYGYTHCPDVCPLHLANIAAVLHKLGPEITRQIKVVFVTVDPARDTPELMRAWLDKFDPSFIGLTGDSLAIHNAITQVRVGVTPPEMNPDGKNYDIGHSAFVIAFTRDNLAHVVYPFGIRQEDWARDLPRLVKD
jgi:protein SCO1/2